MKNTICSLNLEEMKVDLSAKISAIPQYTAKQIWDWLYKKGVENIDDMTNLPKSLRTELGKFYYITSPKINSELISRDGTTKWLLDLTPPEESVLGSKKKNKKLYEWSSEEIETVYIPDYTRGTLCVSSQIGCSLNCSFCHTGTQNVLRNLEVDEIVAQVRMAKSRINDWGKNRAMLTNIVFMGMGEPFLNYESVAKAINILCADDGINMSRRKITVSTSGIIPNIERCAEELRVRLAISLHAVDDSIRDEIVPINRKYPLKPLLAACRYYAEKTGNERITFEYVMLDRVNDSDDDARRLVKLLQGIPAKVNLIPFNPWPGTKYQCSSPERIRSFARIIEAAGYVSPVRQPRGQDIMAACGQLRSESKRMMQSDKEVDIFIEDDISRK